MAAGGEGFARLTVAGRDERGVDEGEAQLTVAGWEERRGRGRGGRDSTIASPRVAAGRWWRTPGTGDGAMTETGDSDAAVSTRRAESDDQIRGQVWVLVVTHGP